MKQKLHREYAKALAEVRSALTRKQSAQFESANYAEIPDYEILDIESFVKHILSIWDIDLVLIQKQISNTNRFTGQWNFYVSDVDGAINDVLVEVGALEHTLIINPHNMHAVHFSCDEQPPESDHMLSITICPCDDNLLKELKRMWPNAYISLRN